MVLYNRTLPISLRCILLVLASVAAFASRLRTLTKQDAYLLAALKCSIATVLVGPIVGGLVPWIVYGISLELTDASVGVTAAVLIAIIPGMHKGSMAGSTTFESIGVAGALFTFYLLTLAYRFKSLILAIATAVVQHILIKTTPGLTFLDPVIVLYLYLARRLSAQNWATWYVSIGFLASSFVFRLVHLGTRHAVQTETVFAVGILLLELGARHQSKLGIRSKIFYSLITDICLCCSAMALGLANGSQNIKQYFSVLDLTAKNMESPEIASTIENQPPTWSTMYSNLHVLSFLVPIGFSLTAQKKELGDLLLGSFSLVSLTSISSAIVWLPYGSAGICIQAAVGIAKILSCFLALLKMSFAENQHRAIMKSRSAQHNKTSKAPEIQIVSEKNELNFEISVVVVVGLLLTLSFWGVHSGWIVSQNYASSSIVFLSKTADDNWQQHDDFREALSWIRLNTPKDSFIFSWPDYASTIESLSHRSSVQDSHLPSGFVAEILLSPEQRAAEELRAINASYVMIVFGGAIGLKNDDLNKAIWMVRFASSYNQNFSSEHYQTPSGKIAYGENTSPAMSRSLLYRASYHQYAFAPGSGKTLKKFKGFDRSRHAIAPLVKLNESLFLESFTSENWLVRIYQRKC